MPRLIALAVLLTGISIPQFFVVWAQTPADRLKAAQANYPPWQHGDGNDAKTRGLEFTVPPVDLLADFHGSLDSPQLVLFASGNYFFSLGQAVEAFGRTYPQYAGHIFYETLPPGLLLQQMDAGGTVSSGNMTWTVKPERLPRRIRRQHRPRAAGPAGGAGRHLCHQRSRHHGAGRQSRPSRRPRRPRACRLGAQHA